MGKQANLLIFYLHLDALNLILDNLRNSREMLPKDLQIFKIGERESYLGGYFLMMSSKEFPLVKEGERCKEGILDFDKGMIIWKKK